MNEIIESWDKEQEYARRRMELYEFPNIIQGGMGAAVSNWELASAVAREGAMGTVSGVGTGMLLTRRLQDGHIESAESLLRFPDRKLAEKYLDKYFNENGRETNHRTETLKPYKKIPMYGYSPVRGVDKVAEDLNLLGAFAEVDMAIQASEGKGKVGINFLEKIQETTMSGLAGAMLAGVDYVIMGAGIPKHVPRVLDEISLKQRTHYPLHVIGETKEDRELGRFNMPFDINQYPEVIEALGQDRIKRPHFLAIVTLDLLAKSLERGDSPPDGYVVELPMAGGHNIPPRKPVQYDDVGEPIYNEAKDYPNYDKLKELDVPFWLAGGFGDKDGLQRAKELGAVGIQVGTNFAMSEESGIPVESKRMVQERILSGQDMKIMEIEDTLSSAETYEARRRVCDLGYLRERVRVEDESSGEVNIEYRCPSEPVDAFIGKGGDIEQTVGRMCLCNGLISTVGMPQLRRGEPEPAVFTIGDAINDNVREIHAENDELDTEDLPTAKQVIQHLQASTE